MKKSAPMFEQLVVAISEPELAELGAVCTAAGMSPSDVLRLGCATVVASRPVFRALATAEAERRRAGEKPRRLIQALRESV